MPSLIAQIRRVSRKSLALQQKLASRKLEEIERKMWLQQEAFLKAIDELRAEMRQEFAAAHAIFRTELSSQLIPLTERVEALEACAHRG